MFKVYLAGPISGLTFDGATDWREHFSKTINANIVCYSPLRAKEFLKEVGVIENAYDTLSPLASDEGITGRDRFDCMGADLVVFNLLGATQRVTIGTMIELGWADAMRRPAVLIMEKSGNIHDHPMVRKTTQFRVETVDAAIKVTEAILLPSKNWW